MSKPKKSGLSTGKLNAQIRGLEKAINRAYGQLDDAESLLMASLDQGKLQADPYDVAGQIREYIESSQDGWDCDSSGQAFLFPSSRFFDILEQFLLPSAFGDTELRNENADENQGPAPASSWPKQICEGQGKTWYPDSSLCCSADETVVDDQCVSKKEQCEKSGGSWNSSTKKCVSKEDQCKKSGGTWTNNECVSKEEQCENRQRIWNPAKNICCLKNMKVINGQCTSQKRECQNRQGNWKWEKNQCVEIKCSGGQKVQNGKCVCPRDKAIFSKGKCQSLQEKKCGDSEGSWDNSSKQCVCAGTDQILKNGRCIKVASPPQLGEPCKKDATSLECKKKTCENQQRPWNSVKNICCLKNMKVINGQCTSQKRECQNRQGNWKWEKNQCVEIKCSGGQTVQNGKCVCPRDKAIFSKGKCQSLQEKKCGDSEGNWNNSSKKCVCAGTDQILKNGRCIKVASPPQIGEPCKKDASSLECKKKTCENQQRTWNPAKKECCPSGKSRLVNGRCLGPEPKRPDMTKKQICEANRQTWNPAKKECCPADKGRLVDDQCLEAKPKKELCPEWKKHKAFGKNGNVRSNFCDEYASNKRDCKKALDKIKNRAKRISQLKDRETQLEDQLSEAQMAGLKGSTKDTEANGLCFDCLKRVLHASRPTTGQNVGNVLNLLTGAGMTAIGYNIGRRSQADLNMLRIQQGYESQHDYYSLMGASAGFPFMARGLHGMTRTNTPVGGWACSPTMSPYGHAYNYQHGQGFNMPYY